MNLEAAPLQPDRGGAQDGYTVPHSSLLKLGHGDAAAGRRLLRTLIDVEMVHALPSRPVPRPSNVRVATEADEAAILELLRLDHAENAACVAPFDEQHARSFMEAATRENTATIGLIDGPDGPVGLVYLLLEVWWFSATWYLAERLLYVRKEHRGGHAATDLLRFAMSFADDMTGRTGETIYLISSVVGTQDVLRKAAVFGRMMTRAGGVYVHPPPAG